MIMAKTLGMNSNDPATRSNNSIVDQAASARRLDRSVSHASKDLCMDRLIVQSKRERAGSEEGANDVGAAAQAADRAADAGFQHWQVRRAQPAQGVLFQPSP